MYVNSLGNLHTTRTKITDHIHQLPNTRPEKIIPA